MAALLAFVVFVAGHTAWKYCQPTVSDPTVLLCRVCWQENGQQICSQEFIEPSNQPLSVLPERPPER
jgi:hypothetical protein